VRQERGSNQTRPESLLNAERLLSGLFREKPEEPAVLILKGRAELLEGQYDPAIETLSRASADPQALIDLACAYALRADVENRKEDSAQALELLLRSLRISPADPRALFNLALVYQRMSLLDEAITAWKKYLEIDPSGEWAQEGRERLAELERIKQKKESPHAALSGDEARLEVAWTEWLPELTCENLDRTWQRTLTT
jgi:tetratricopeptide (TPR) repeat protein